MPVLWTWHKVIWWNSRSLNYSIEFQCELDIEFLKRSFLVLKILINISGCYLIELIPSFWHKSCIDVKSVIQGKQLMQKKDNVHEMKFLTIRIRQIYPYDMSKGVWSPPKHRYFNNRWLSNSGNFVVRNSRLTLRREIITSHVIFTTVPDQHIRSSIKSCCKNSCLTH